MSEYNPTPRACYLLLPMDVLQSVMMVAVIHTVSERQDLKVQEKKGLKKPLFNVLQCCLIMLILLKRASIGCRCA